MSETKPAPRSEPFPTPQMTMNECYLCRRKESGAWHYAASLGRFVCEDCFRRAMSAPRPPPAPVNAGVRPRKSSHESRAASRATLQSTRLEPRS